MATRTAGFTRRSRDARLNARRAPGVTLDSWPRAAARRTSERREAAFLPGAIAYESTVNDIPIVGHSLTAEDTADLENPVQALLNDSRGMTEARAALDDLARTDFGQHVLEEILAPTSAHPEWRVGEALGENHLTVDHACEFPWPECRSTRNPGSSGGGVDLIGFHDSRRIRFAFGEVKTSHQQRWPPSIVTSRTHGLQTQLHGLSVGDDRRKWAIKYLVLNSMGRSWHTTLRAAIESYLDDPDDVVVFGVLIHIAEPRSADLTWQPKALSELRPASTEIRLIAIYLDTESLQRLAGGAISVETAA